MSHIQPRKKIEDEPCNILPPDKYKCRYCGENRMDNLEIEVVINSVPCTVYQLFCNTCGKEALIDVLSSKAEKELRILEEMEDGGRIHLQDNGSVNITSVRSALSGNILDRKTASTGEK